ncbi:helix-turn-helix domain-containing protein [Granulicella sp. 5B5]|uniref:helix-turn-helix domain-containing protein n=1 Tax=Granulicella sp. 5B5 TaxID=1617967 RepID=UPI0015F3EA8A|nr:helix-turn-helix domain-containing protein [Granulicella sp. 5B5]QMV19656.1 helix-turn-helix domain-containing protein [Granulicella sp. 5B5]
MSMFMEKTFIPLVLPQAMFMFEIGNIFKVRREKLRMSAQQVADLAGISRSYYTKLENGDNDGTLKTLVAICGALRLDFETLFTSTGNARILEDDMRRVPLMTLAQAYAWIQSGAEIRGADMYPSISINIDCSPRTIGVVLSDDSMEPQFSKGDTIVCDLNINPRPGCVVLATNTETQASMIRIYADLGTDEAGEKIFELRPRNSFYPTLRSDRKPLFVTAVGIERREPLIDPMVM